MAIRIRRNKLRKIVLDKIRFHIFISMKLKDEILMIAEKVCRLAAKMINVNPFLR